ncbi:hypothetical protein LTR36_007404 [Oleoguttula mirabilis]|uniref:Zn(2)-C6 fungal-type domain-containing protein n=1 Tax=Oleoguttula mirabilis TaxID=1507867 RepID=A0AAV9JBC7_9PEZI|nr:hypothetical protein LTR36_007404 [Oleoguttula mirabilis]
MEAASPDRYDDRMSEGEESGEDGQDLKQEDDLSQTSPSTSSNAINKGAPTVRPIGHAQKRRRVTRACDECRRKKIKCDGKQPCTHCTVYSYECTFDQPSNRRRNPAPQYVENLEHRVHRAETLLHILIPNLDLNDPGIDAAVAQGWIPGAPGKGNPAAAQPPPPRPPPQAPPTNEQNVQPAQNKSDTNLESMVRAVAQMDMDEQGHWDYHGHSSGLSFVRRMREQLGDLMGPDTAATPFVKSRPMSQILDSPKSMGESSPGDVSPGGSELPPKDYARQMCSNAVDDATALLRVVHKPSFWQSFERIYSMPSEQWTNQDNVFLPLFHSVMALGHLFAKDDQGSLNALGYESAIQEGFAHFKTARQMMDIADCRDLTSIQAVMFMILFLQSSAKLSQCYAYVGVALRSATRMGLHRSYAGDWNPIEAELRKRVFWIVRKMDVYIGAMLGLPQTLSDEDVDQDFPLEVDDEYITKDGILPMPEGQVSLMAAFNAHTRLVQIISKIVRKVYPIKTQHSSPDKSYSVPFSIIREIEGDLEQWKNSLPPMLSPCQAPEKYTRIQQLLRLSYAHAQVMLYRPFLHFVAMEKRSKPVDQRAYACAASYVNVSRNIIHITTHMKQRGLLNGAFWFVMYTNFFAILSLVYFAAENPDNATMQAVMKDALEGKQTLASLVTRSMAADRCTATLNVVFQRLPGWMQEGLQNPMMSKKRPLEPSVNLTQPHVAPHASRSHPDVSIVGSGPVGFGAQRRASTFPKHGGQLPVMSPASYEPSWPGTGPSALGPQTSTSNGYDSNAMGQWSEHTASTATSTNGMQQYALPQSFANTALPDLSAMMFPTADEPLSYPNQPLTTFENNQEYAKSTPFTNANAFNSVETSSPMMPLPPRSREDNMEAQFFALPPYIQQPRRQQRQQQQQLPTSFPTDAMSYGTNGQSIGAPTALQMPNGMANGGWPTQQAIPNDLSNINIQDIFGGAEWNSMLMNPGFQSQ